MDHITDDQIEAFALDKLAADDAERVEEHLLECEICAAGVMSELDYISAIRTVLVKTCGPMHLTRDRVLVAVHQTNDGRIELSIRLDGNKWSALITGTQLEFGCECRSRRHAELCCHKAFAELFPEHVCTSVCQSPQAFCAGETG